MTRPCNGLARILFALTAHVLQAGARAAMAVDEALLDAADRLGRRARA